MKVAAALTLCAQARRLTDGGCTAVLGAFGAFADEARLGAPALLAPELLRARRGAALAYTPATDMWCAAVPAPCDI